MNVMESNIGLPHIPQSLKSMFGNNNPHWYHPLVQVQQKQKHSLKLAKMNRVFYKRANTNLRFNMPHGEPGKKLFRAFLKYPLCFR